MTYDFMFSVTALAALLAVHLYLALIDTRQLRLPNPAVAASHILVLFMLACWPTSSSLVAQHAGDWGGSQSRLALVLILYFLSLVLALGVLWFGLFAGIGGGDLKLLPSLLPLPLLTGGAQALAVCCIVGSLTCLTWIGVSRRVRSARGHPLPAGPAMIFAHWCSILMVR